MRNISVNLLFKSFLRKLATNTGIFMSITVLLGAGFTIGTYYSEYKYDRETSIIYKDQIEKEKEYWVEIQRLNSEIGDLKGEVQILKIENERLKTK